MDRTKFEKIIELSKDRRYHIDRLCIDAIAVETGVSARQVHRVKEAGTWERWPYIQAKIKCGYNTPEYKAYLKRRGLPLTPPAKVQVAPREQKLADIRQEAHTELKKRSLLGRLFRRGN